jgi:hypothetical protein
MTLPRYASIEQDGWTLESGEARHDRSPETFHILTNGGCKRIVTSPIVKLVHTQIHPHESLGTVH